MSSLANLPANGGLPARRTTPDQVADLLREAILTGRLEDGAELNQVALAERFSVSRVPIREALRQLQAEGLVRQEAHRRAVVSTLTAERISELFDLRVLLETYMLRRSIAAMDESTIAALDKMMRSMERINDNNHDKWLAANREFHEMLYRPSGATYTLELATSIAARSSRYLYLRSGGARVNRRSQAHHDHADIMTAVRNRDADAGEAALTRHIDGTRSAVLRVLEDRD